MEQRAEPRVGSRETVPEGMVRIIGNRIGCKVVELDDGLVIKAGWRVRPAELLAMELVAKHTSVPIPEPVLGTFKPGRAGHFGHGQIMMTLDPGVCLKDVWHDLDTEAKTSICKQVWKFVEEWRPIPKPLELEHLYQCSVDGKLGSDVFISRCEWALIEKESDILSDKALRERVCDNYYENFGRKYTKEQLFDMLPRSNKPSVFTHGELLPKNIMVSGSQVTAIIDWETAGWYPEYWEHIGFRTGKSDWGSFMTACAPETWNLEGFKAASRVLI